MLTHEVDNQAVPFEDVNLFDTDVALQEALGYRRPTYGHLPIIMNPDGSKMSKRDRDKKMRAAAKVWMSS